MSQECACFISHFVLWKGADVPLNLKVRLIGRLVPLISPRFCWIRHRRYQRRELVKPPEAPPHVPEVGRLVRAAAVNLDHISWILFF